ncbi:MAG: helix-turn-helix domain-containing protein [Chitinivibrionales bacterium]|nr:helix-turn-helix domain-containing protein [Chitinivibrionales bacterium]
MPTLYWNNLAPRGEAYHVTSLTLADRATFYGHDHDFAELFLVDYGQAVHRVGREQHSVRAGDLVTLLPEHDHGFRAVGREGFRYLNVAIPTTVLSFFKQTYFTPTDRLWLENEMPPAVHSLSPTGKRRVQAMIEALSLAPHVRYEIDRFLLNLLHELRTPLVGVQATALPGWLREAYEELVTGRGVSSVSELVRAAGRSHEHVSRVVHQATGMTPTQLVNTVRLTRAAHLLSMTEDSITRIALECGFSNLGHFYRQFKAQYGTTPRKYRVFNKGMAP